ncbi:ubiquitin-specific protease ubp14 [Ancistrocladus abbreviatus]
MAFDEAPADPTVDLNMQLTKLGHGLLSGKYSIPASEQQEGIRPRMFKTVIAASHPEFSTMRQQDALEFFLHLLEQVERVNAGDPMGDPSRGFKFEQVEKFNKLKAQLKSEGKELSTDEIVRPRVALEACLATYSAPEEVLDFYSTALKAKTTATKYTAEQHAIGLESITLHALGILGSRVTEVQLICFSNFPFLKKSLTAELASAPVTGQAALKNSEENPLRLRDLWSGMVKAALVSTSLIGASRSWHYSLPQDFQLASPVVAPALGIPLLYLGFDHPKLVEVSVLQDASRINNCNDTLAPAHSYTTFFAFIVPSTLSYRTPLVNSLLVSTPTSVHA